MENYTGKICPFCKTQIVETDTVKVCPACGIPHHEGCWNENHGCTTFGCSEQHYEAQHTNPTSVCTACGAPLGDGQLFCPMCGTPKASPQKLVCPKCGGELQEGQQFCAQCGHKVGAVVDNASVAAINQFNANVGKKQKKNKLLPIILAVILAVAGIFGVIINNIMQEKKAEEEEKQRQEAIEEYIRNANSFYSKVLSSGKTMEDIGNEIQTSWKAYVNSSRYNGKRYYSVDDAIDAALDHESSRISTVKNANSSIESLYKKLLTLPDTSNQELQEIKSVVKDAYKAYQNMYDCVITPSGSYNTWTAEFSDVDTDLAEAIQDLYTLVN